MMWLVMEKIVTPIAVSKLHRNLSYHVNGRQMVRSSA